MVEGRYSAAFLATIDSALAVKPSDRPRSVAAFRRMLDGLEAPPPAPAAPPVALASQPMAAAPDADPVDALTWSAGSAVDLALPDASVEAVATASLAAAPPELPAGQVRPAPVDADGNGQARARSPSTRRLAAALAAGVVMVAATVVLVSGRNGPSAQPPSPASGVPAASADAPTAAATVLPDAHSPAPAPAQAPDPLVQDAVIAPDPVTTAPARAAPAAGPAAPGGRRSRRPTTPSTPAAPQANQAEAATAEPLRPVQPARRTEGASPAALQCSEILQKASLQPLSAAESAFLKRDCQ